MPLGGDIPSSGSDIQSRHEISFLQPEDSNQTGGGRGDPCFEGEFQAGDGQSYVLRVLFLYIYDQTADGFICGKILRFNIGA